MIYSLVKTTLLPIGVPVSLRVYNGTAPTYITYFEVVDVPTLHGDDDLLETEKVIQVDIWSKGDFLPVLDEVKARMKAAGFQFSDGGDDYEADTKLFRYILTYNYSYKVSL